MKNSRKYAIITLLLVALFTAGAVLGTLVGATIMYAIIAAVAVAAALLIVFGYTGVRKEDDDSDYEEYEE